MSKCLVGPKFITEVNGKTGSSINLSPEDVGGLSNYTCTTSEGNHALVGQGDNIKFIADANYSEGNTITVNGKTVTAKLQNGGPLSSDNWVAGAVVTCYLNGETLNFKGGDGLSAADMAVFIPENLRKDVVLFAGTPREVVGSLTWQDLLPDNIDIVGEGIIQSNTYEGSAKTGDTAVSFKCLPAFDVTKYSAVMFSGCTCTGMHDAGRFKSGYCFIEDQTGKRLASAPQNGAIDLKSVSGFIYFGFGGTVSNSWGAETPYKLTIGGLTLTEI